MTVGLQWSEGMYGRSLSKTPETFSFIILFT